MTTLSPSLPGRWLPGWLRRDKVLIATALILLVLALLDRPQAWRSVVFVVQAFIGIAPFFLLAVAVAGCVRAAGLERIIAGVFAGSRYVSVALAAAVGALSPFCSCGVIPLIASMLRAGVPLAPVMAFCIASPVMDPEMFILTAAGISPGFAAAKTVTAIGMGLLAGFAVTALQKQSWIHAPLRTDWQSGCGAQLPQEIVPRFWREPRRRRWFMEETAANGVFLGRWLAFAFLLESLMVAYIPPGWVSGLVGGDSLPAVALAALVGMPSYLNGYAAIPLVSGLMEIGMSAAAAMAFITTGAVSSIPAAVAMYALVRRSVFLLYLALGFVGAVLCGHLYGVWLAL